MLTENKFSKYLLYAIGEIILVVIGILIALQINNWNEHRKAIAKTEHLLTKVYKELEFNIYEINKLNRYYRGKDSLAYKVLNAEVTYNDYKTNKRYASLLQGVPLANLKDNAFKNLINHEAKFTQQQDSLLLKLTDLYDKNKTQVDIADEGAIMRLQKHAQKIKDEKPWYYYYTVKDESTDEMVDYFLNDPIYLNEVAHYAKVNLFGHNWAALIYRNNAMEIYKEMSQHLNLPKDTLIIKDLTLYEHYLGIYTDSLNIIEVKKELDNFIYIRKTKKDSIEVARSNLYPETKDLFTVGGSYGQLMFKNRKVDRFILSSGHQRLDCVRAN